MSEFDEIWKHQNHSCQPLLGVNLSPEFLNLYFPYAGQGLLFFCWWQRHFEFRPVRVAVEGRNNVGQNTCARLQISLLMRFIALGQSACIWRGRIRLLLRQFFNLFARFKTKQNLIKNLVFLYPSCFPIWPYPPK